MVGMITSLRDGQSWRKRSVHVQTNEPNDVSRQDRHYRASPCSDTISAQLWHSSPVDLIEPLQPLTSRRQATESLHFGPVAVPEVRCLR